jgi:hypothetical protein
MQRLMFALFALFAVAAAPRADERWMTLPPTPDLPKAKQSGLASINGANIWYATFGAGEPVLLLHGGLASANYWGHQVRAAGTVAARRTRRAPGAAIIASSSWIAAATGAAPTTASLTAINSWPTTRSACSTSSA